MAWVFCTKLAGGQVAQADRREFGPAQLIIDDTTDLFAGFSSTASTQVWMSHGDKMESLPPGWTVLAPFGQLAHSCLPR